MKSERVKSDGKVLFREGCACHFWAWVLGFNYWEGDNAGIASHLAFPDVARSVAVTCELN